MVQYFEHLIFWSWREKLSKTNLSNTKCFFFHTTVFTHYFLIICVYFLNSHFLLPHRNFLQCKHLFLQLRMTPTPSRALMLAQQSLVTIIKDMIYIFHNFPFCEVNTHIEWILFHNLEVVMYKCDLLHLTIQNAHACAFEMIVAFISFSVMFFCRTTKIRTQV